jgi:hypothetical protein
MARQTAGCKHLHAAKLIVATNVGGKDHRDPRHPSGRATATGFGSRPAEHYQIMDNVIRMTHTHRVLVVAFIPPDH